MKCKTFDEEINRDNPLENLATASFITDTYSEISLFINNNTGTKSPLLTAPSLVTLNLQKCSLNICLLVQ